MQFTLGLLFLWTICVGAVKFAHEFVDNDLLSGCHFNLGANNYDLCPLIISNSSGVAKGEASEYESTGGAAVDRSYTIVLGGMGRNRECPEGTWICMNRTHGDFDNTQQGTQIYTTGHIPISGKSRPASLLVDQGFNAVASILGANNYPATPHINIFFIGGFWQGKAQYARIDFICDLSGKHGAPYFVEERDEVHIFTWITQHSCPINRQPSFETEPRPASEEEKRLVVDKSSMTLRRTIVFSFVAISPILVAFFIILIRPREREILFTHTGAPHKGRNEKGLDEHTILNSGSRTISKAYGSATLGQTV